MTIPVAIDRPDVMSSFYAYNIPLSSSNGNFNPIYVVIIAATADADGLCMNGTLLPLSSFNRVGSSSFSAARLVISAGHGTVTHVNGKPFTAYWFGYSSMEGASSILPAVNVSSAARNVSFTCSAVASKTTVATSKKPAVTTAATGTQAPCYSLADFVRRKLDVTSIVQS
jgi:hypothetical protein